MNEMKALIAFSVDEKYPFHYYLKFHETLKLSETAKEILSKKNEAELQEYIKDKIEEIEAEEKLLMHIPKKKWSMQKYIGIGLIVLLVPALIYSFYSLFFAIPKQEAYVESNRLFLNSQYSEVINKLSKYDADKMPVGVQYQLARSYIITVSLTEEQRDNIEDSLSLQADPQYFMYWIHIGRGNNKEAIDIARMLVDRDLIVYGLINYQKEMMASSELDSQEKEQQMKQIDSELQEYRNELEQQHTEDEQSDAVQGFRQEEMSHLKLYNALAEDELPIIFLALDNFDVVKEEMYDYEQEFIKFSRDGQSLGIYLIISATRVNAVRQSLMNNLKTKMVHYLMDQTEAYGVIGKPQFSLEPIPGRVIIKTEASHFAHVFLPVEASDDITLFDELKSEVQQIRKTYADREMPKPIPMLPSELSMHDFEELYVPDRKKPGFIPLGLDEETVQPVYMALAKTKHCIVMGQSQKGKTNVIKLILKYLLDGKTNQIAVFDSIDRGLSDVASEEKINNIETKDEIKEWLSQNEEVFKTREAMYLEAVQQREAQNLSFASVVLVIDGFGRFQQTIDGSIQDKITSFMRSYAHLGFHLIVSGNAADFTKGYDSLTTEVKQVRQAVLLMKKSDQNMIPLPYERQETDILPGYGYLIDNGKERKIQIPLCSMERKKAI